MAAAWGGREALNPAGTQGTLLRCILKSLCIVELKLRCVGHLALLCGGAVVASLEIFSVRAMGDPAPPPALMAPPPARPTSVAVESASDGAAAAAVGRCGGGGCAVILRGAGVRLAWPQFD